MDPARRPAGAPDVKPEPAAPPPAAGDEQDPSSQFAKDGYIKFASPRRPLEAIAEAASSPPPKRGGPRTGKEGDSPFAGLAAAVSFCGGSGPATPGGVDWAGLLA